MSKQQRGESRQTTTEGHHLSNRAISNDLKLRIMKLADSHPARRNASLVFAALVELALSLVLSQFGSEARDVWIGAFDHAEEHKTGAYDA